MPINFPVQFAKLLIASRSYYKEKIMKYKMGKITEISC